MDLTVTVETGDGARADVRVQAPPDAAAAALLDALREQAGVAAAVPLWVEGRKVPADGTVADCGLRHGDVVVAADRPPPGRACRFVLAATAGPDCGRRYPLAAGRHVVGRDPSCAVVVADPAVSRHHAVLDITSETVSVTALPAANGTTLDGRPLEPGQPQAAALGATIGLARQRLRLEPAADPAPAPPRIVRQAPRLAPPAALDEVVFPSPPSPPARPRLPLLGALLPVVGGAALSLAVHQWQFLAFTALSPLMLLGQGAGDRWSARRAHRRARREHLAATAAAEAELCRRLAAERARREAADPDVATLTAGVTAIWQRRQDDEDGLRVRLGRGCLPSEVRVRGRPDRPGVADVPVCVSLRDEPSIGLCGPAPDVTALARALVVQAALNHSPGDLRIVVLAPGDAAAWAWTRWLPHVAPAGAASATVAFDHQQASQQVTALADRTPAGPHALVVVAGAERLSAEVVQRLAEPPAGASVVWCAHAPATLPRSCGVVGELSAGGTLQLRRARCAPQSVAADLLAADVAEAAARRLAPVEIHGGEPDRAVPRVVSWADLVGIDLSSPAAAGRCLAEGWRRPAGASVVLGTDGRTPLRVDLATDGPHLLVAGTTGSGKSELLLTLVAGLAAGNPPDRLAFLLVDHKGGASFGPLRTLPHTLGVVTDLDRHGTERALLAISAELRRREAHFAQAGAADLAAYQASAPAVPIGRLVIVVDEFAALVDAHPQAAGRLVAIAQRGRSLGIHLVIATQRPESVVAADIRANTRLRICLGVAREQESRDVVDAPDAARISRRTPGRGYLRAGAGEGELRLFQTARVGGVRTRRRPIRATVSPAETLGDPASDPMCGAPTGAGSDLDILVAAAARAAADLAHRGAPASWLPPLPDRLPLSSLPRAEASGAPWALADRPAEGRQDPLVAAPDTPQTVIVAGGPRSGRTTAAIAYALALTRSRRNDEVHVWALDGATGLAGLEALPHCGAVVPLDDPERVHCVLDHVSQEVALRRRRPGDHPALLLVIDPWEALDALDGPDRAVVDAVVRLAVEGPSAGLHLLVTGGRSVLSGRLAVAAATKVVLRLPDPSDLVLIGMAPRDLPTDLPPGRGVRAGDLALVQVAEPDQPSWDAAGAPGAAVASPRRFPRLPARVALPDLPPAAGTDGLVLGVGGDGDPLVVPAADLVGTLLVLGPAGSGRSTALVLIARQLADRPLALVTGTASGLHLPEAVVLPRDDQAHAVDLLDRLDRAARPPHLFVDDADGLADGPLVERLEALAAAPGEAVFALTATVQAATVAFRGPLATAARRRRALLLGAVRGRDAELLGIRLPAHGAHEVPAGRGWLALGGRPRRVQLADPDASPAPGGRVARAG